MRILRYPVYLLLGSPIVIGIGIIGIIIALKNNFSLAQKYLFIPSFYFVGMIGLSIVTGSDPLAAPLRMIVPFVYLLIPFSLSLFFDSGKKMFQKIGYGFAVLVILANIFMVYNFDRSDFQDVSGVSKVLSIAHSKGILSGGERVFFEVNSLGPFGGDHMALMVLLNQPERVILHEASGEKGEVDKVIKRVKGNNIGAFVASSKSLKDSLWRVFPNSTFLGVYEIFWTSEFGKENMGSEFKCEMIQPKSINQQQLDSGIKLVGYSLGKGRFPNAVTTHWEINKKVEIPLVIEYKLIKGETSGGANLLFSKNINRSSLWEGKTVVNDMQELILSKGSLPGKYAIAVRLVEMGGDHMKNQKGDFSPGKWHYLTEVDLITNKRDTLNCLLSRRIKDYRLGFKVIASLL